jgi:hypothetical protein
MTQRFKLSEAAKAILSEGSKETFDANIKAKQGARGQDHHKKGEVGDDKLPASTAYGEKEAGLIGSSPDKTSGESLPDYLKGTPSATPPGATPPVGSEKDGVGFSKPKGQPQETMGRSDLLKTQQASANEYESLRDRKGSHLAAQTFQKNPGATFQSYSEGLDMSDDVRALLDGEGLSEEFAQKATTIFEAAVTSRIEQIAEQIENGLQEQFEAAVEQVKEDLATKLDDYIGYMAEEYMKENALAIESGLRAEIAEDFINALRNVFVENYIDIPEDKVDVVAEMAEKVAELEAQLNEEITKNISLNKDLNEQKKIEAIYAVCEGLTQTQVEKMKSLAEGVEFTTEEEFAAKLSTLVESYFKADVKVADNSSLDDEVHIEEEKKTSVSADPLMEQYASVISKTLK